VSWRSSPAPGLCSIEQPTITGIAATGEITTPYRHSTRKEGKAIVVDILSSRRKTDRKVLNWVMRPGEEHGRNLLTDRRLSIEDYLAFMDGDFGSIT
jgi:hypothetical protein